MFSAVIMMGGLGLVIGMCLALASKMFYVYVDPKVVAIDDILPGANCGGCGMPGCFANAEAIVAGQTGPDSCVAAGEDVAEAIAGVMGVSIEEKEAEKAFLGCFYGLDCSDVKFVYDGINDCRAAALLNGGMKVCNIGCLGLGTCVSHCPFGAITIANDGLPRINDEKCTGCGSCVRVCPKKIIDLTSTSIKILKEYTSNDCITPCQRACPAGINIREYISLVEEGDYVGAVQVIKERNPFPTVIGRICPRPCEDECRRKYVDESVDINGLKQFVSDYEMSIGKHIIPYKAPNTGRKIAIVGGGVHGLSCAFFIVRLGHLATVFEGSDKLGGLLNRAIADYRLSSSVLDWDIEGISELGVNFEMSTIVGHDITVNGILDQGFEYVFIASGGWDSRISSQYYYSEMNSPIPGAFLLIDFLSNNFNTISSEVSDILCVGGGALLDAIVKKSKSLNISKISVLTQENDNVEFILSKDYGRDISIEIIDNYSFCSLKGELNKLTGVEVVNFNEDKKRILKVQMILFSAGRFPEMVFSKDDQKGDFFNEKEVDSNTTWIGSYMNNDFSDDDTTKSDFSSAIKAIGNGRRAAAGINNIMYEKVLSLPKNILKSDSFVQNINVVENVSEVPRNIVPIIENKKLFNSNCEKEIGFTPELAHLEASRCLKCGLICYEKTKKKEL